jgi:hypothetical protein
VCIVSGVIRSAHIGRNGASEQNDEYLVIHGVRLTFLKGQENKGRVIVEVRIVGSNELITYTLVEPFTLQPISDILN